MTTTPRVLAGRYRVDELIGRGGMAMVYRGYDEKLGRDIAIKLLDRELARDTGFRTRFRREAQAASRMSHTSIVRVFDAGEEAEEDGTLVVPYIIMELVEGTLLKNIIARGPLPAADAVRYVDGILEALEYSHMAGVVHRDIKPGNVMITKSGGVKVMDFGIARAVADSSSTVAETTAIIGTAAYFSPEQAKGDPVDARADLYSTGVVLFELLTGRQPFRGDSPVAVAYQHVSEPPTAPSDVNEASPPALDPIVLQALAKDPSQRYEDAASFRAALKMASSGKALSKRQLGALASELYGESPRQAQETARTIQQLSTDTTMTRTQAGPPAAWIWAGVAFMGVLLISVLIWVLMLPKGAETPANARDVPDVVEVSAEKAQETIEAADLKFTIRTEPHQTVPNGFVIRTDPEAGAQVKIGQTITLYVSSGEDLAVVPELVGLSLADAKAALEKAGLVAGQVRPLNDPQASADTVLAASEDEGTEVAPGTVINLTVASGRVSLRDLTGFTLEVAEQELIDLGLNPIHEPNDTCQATDPVTVISMSVAPGDVAIKSDVALRFCSG